MALKAMMLKRKLDTKKNELNAKREQLAGLESREAELEQAIEEAAAMEEGEEKEEAQKLVEEQVDAFEAEKKEAEEAAEALESEVEDLEAELDEVEGAQEDSAPVERAKENEMEIRDKGIFEREDVQQFLGEVRTAIKEKRAVNGVGVLIPEVFLGILRENIENYSKLYKYVTVRSLGGTGRMAIMGQIDEAIWTECCANLNELTLNFYDVEIDCYKVGGYYAVCNATLEDSDINLAQELISAIGQAIGLALDKAILYGKNTSANQKMPLGIVSRLAQTSEPSGYPATARPWVDLHETNIISIPSGTTGAALIAAIVGAFGAAQNKYANGKPVFVMNRKTYAALGQATITTAADGSIVTGVFNQMPVIGGDIVVLDFLADNIIIGGYFGLYLLGERAGKQFATSEHVRFLQDQTVMKGTARYDGTPVIPEGFVAIGLEGVTPDATMTFAADTANQGA